MSSNIEQLRRLVEAYSDGEHSDAGLGEVAYSTPLRAILAEMEADKAALKRMWSEAREYVNRQAISLASIGDEEVPSNAANAVGAAFWNMNKAMAEQGASIAKLEAVVAEQQKPSYWWNDEDPETPYDSPDEWLESEDWGIEHGYKIAFMTAKKLPTRYYRVVNVSDNDQELVEITKEEYDKDEAALEGGQK